MSPRNCSLALAQEALNKATAAVERLKLVTAAASTDVTRIASEQLRGLTEPSTAAHSSERLLAALAEALSSGDAAANPK